MGYFSIDESLPVPASTPETAYPLSAEAVSGHRYYQPESGRWASRDPGGYNGGLNLYQYVYNDANVYVDDLGNEPKLLPPHIPPKLLPPHNPPSNGHGPEWPMDPAGLPEPERPNRPQRTINMGPTTCPCDKKLVTTEQIDSIAYLYNIGYAVIGGLDGDYERPGHQIYYDIQFVQRVLKQACVDKNAHCTKHGPVESHYRVGSWYSSEYTDWLFETTTWDCM